MTPKKRRVTLARDQANTSTDSPSDEFYTTPLSEDKSWPTDQGTFAKEIPLERLGQKRRGEPDDLCDASGDEGVAPGPRPTHGMTATYEDLNAIAIKFQGLRPSFRPGKGHKALHGTASKSGDLGEKEGAQLTSRQIMQRPNSSSNLAQPAITDGEHDSRMKPAFSSIRVSKGIRLRKQVTEAEHQQPPQQSIASSSAHLSESSPMDSNIWADKMGRPSTIECDIAEGQSSSPVAQPTEYNSANFNNFRSDNFPSYEDARSAARIRALGLHFKARKLRGNFDTAAVKDELGVDLSLGRAQRLRDLSGNDMAAAVDLYLRGFCNTSRRQQASSASSQEGARKRQTSSETLSSIAFYQQMRQFEKQRLKSSLERGIRASMKSSKPLEEKRRTSAVGEEEKIALITSRAGSPQTAWPRDLAGHAPGHKRDEIRVEGAQEAESDGNSYHIEDGNVCSDLDITEANEESENSGTGPVPLRGIQGFTNTNQENVRPRNPPSNTSRLPNGKLGALTTTR